MCVYMFGEGSFASPAHPNHYKGLLLELVGMKESIPVSTLMWFRLHSMLSLDVAPKGGVGLIDAVLVVKHYLVLVSLSVVMIAQHTKRHGHPMIIVGCYDHPFPPS